MRRLVIGDIHGNHHALMQCLERSSFDNENDQLIQLGDVVDGGECVFECVERLLSIKNLVVIRGNHDDWFLDWINTGYHTVSWTFGGRSTLTSYARRVGKQHLIKMCGTGAKSPINPEHIPCSHRAFFASQKPYHIDSDNNLFVHGGFNRHEDFFRQRSEHYYWDRELWASALQWQIDKKYSLQHKSEPFAIFTSFNTIFIGHTSTMHWNIDRPMRAANIINLDTGGGPGGRLTIMDVDTKQFWQSGPMHSCINE